MNTSERDELCFLSAVDLVALVRTREVSPVEIVDAVLDRMRELDPVLHAFCTPTPELALERAARLAGELARGTPAGLLAGVPMGIKDLLSTKGIRTTSGSWIYRDFVPDQDDVVVERSLAAGAICLSKTTTSEFGYSPTGQSPLFPAPRNPWDLESATGGSSAGSAAAVAAGLGPVALGSDGDARSAHPPRCEDWSGRNRRWAACPCIPAAVTSGSPECPDGRASNISVRSPARWPMPR